MNKSNQPMVSNDTSLPLKAAAACLKIEEHGKIAVIDLSGAWSLENPVPTWEEVIQELTPAKVEKKDADTTLKLDAKVDILRVNVKEVTSWDTALILFLLHGKVWCQKTKKKWEETSFPASLKKILHHTEIEKPAVVQEKKQPAPLRFFLGTAALRFWNELEQALDFIGNSTLGIGRVLMHRSKFRWMDTFVEMQRCWESSLPIVSLISFLVGVILAFQSALQLKQYGVGILVADLVGLAVVREMGPMMAAIVVAGGTGAGFAAQLGNMRVNEEIDALETLGISSIDFLVLPRLVATFIMMPILALYANVLGILGGLFISATLLSIPASAYWIETQSRVSFMDVSSGIIKSFVFGIIIALAGCSRGMQCERTTSGVGDATSSAVVTGIMLIVIGDAIFAIIYNALGI